jgi:hypothetical protein
MGNAVLYVAFGLNIGNLGRQSQRLPMNSWLGLFNKGFASRCARAEALDSFGHTGNFLISAETERASNVAEWLSAISGRQWAVLRLDEVSRYLSRLKRLTLPTAPARTRYIPGLIFRIDAVVQITSVESTVRAQFKHLSDCVVAAWKLDRVTGAGGLDTKNRGGGWGAVALDLGRQVGGVWTARSARSVQGVVTLRNGP